MGGGNRLLWGGVDHGQEKGQLAALRERYKVERKV
jgi:hypothetical protein